MPLLGPTPLPGSGPRRSRGRLTWAEVLAAAVYLLAVGLFVALGRPHVSTLNLFGAVMLALLVPTIRRPQVWLRGVGLDWMPLLGVLRCYDWLRGRADRVNTHVHWQPQLALDRLLGGGQPLAVRLQRLAWWGVPHWWDWLAAAVYLSHFLATMLALAALWVIDTALFRRLRQLVLTVVGLAFVTYFAYPAAPPWCAASTGRSGPADRVVFDTLHLARLPDCRAGDPGDLANPVAALPSLHASLPLLLCVFFWAGARRWARGLLLLYVVAMAVTLVYGAEHFVFDELLGYAYVLGAHAFWRRRWRRVDTPDRTLRPGAGWPAVAPQPAMSTPG